ncbi:hypothetical protein QAO71_15760 [Halopseudomonas sp. SMJS2]|uniref:hypothetical protein n=1 Tax=Halopseudomonas sp. SMJS2 TaxID=3041098 RepID=UPI002452B742|nr:hypothetical protein [Halopseudomonas sp. SMJS2]WGK61481.1 hypothetical protein QAO71_15760 [Halopseudomonas sp. SMJS2]
MRIDQANGTLQRIGGATVYLNNFTDYSGQNLPNTKWPLWPNVRNLSNFQAALLEQHARALPALQKIRENADLTSEAKTRQSREVFNEFALVVKSGFPSVTECAANLATYAQRNLRPVQDIEPTDAASAALDAECRAYAFKLKPEGRAELVGDIHQGIEQRIAAAILRGPARLSGFTRNQLIALGAAGIAANYPDAVMTLGKLACSMRDLHYMTQTLGHDVVSAGASTQKDQLSKEVGSWGTTNEGLNALIEWLKPIPLELPRKNAPGEVGKARDNVEAD